ncbi:uncharacterized protein LOC116352502 [Contarinia nasturtii]|uniref:uncharacterized protein LOC116352502 n=1 Tax=Contarinia nasturtii TaxID=265458 RepID=UPI0012D4348D|nr:uncharacterized protein LOC116352502 [Contarinia nasturtii]
MAVREYKQSVFPLYGKHPTVHSNRAISLLNNFGPLIHGLSFDTNRGQEPNENIFKSILKNCCKTLKHLEIINCVADFEHIQFDMLETLVVYNSTVKNFNFGSPLKRFHLVHSKQEIWFMRKFPELGHIFFSSKVITDSVIGEFVLLNPQLKVLNLRCCENLSPLILKYIANCCSNLVELDFYFMIPKIKDYEKIMHLGSLRSLKKLGIKLQKNILINQLINMFVENNIPIEELYISLEKPKNDNRHSYKNLKTLTTLKRLELTIQNGRKWAFGKTVKNIVKSQTALKILHVCGSIHGTLSILEVESILKYGKKLSDLKLDVYELTDNLESYQRFKISNFFRYCKIFPIIMYVVYKEKCSISM